MYSSKNLKFTKTPDKKLEFPAISA
eukprot:SAG11_NODE_12696_length_690_cov_1.021997_1_plen_24_part_10